MRHDVELREPLLSTLLRAADAVLIFLAHRLAMYLRMDVTLLESRTLAATLLAATVFSIVASASGLYGPAVHSVASGVVTRKVWTSWGVTVLLLIASAIAFRATDRYSRVVTLVWFLLTPCVLSVFRSVARKVHEALRRRAAG